MTPPGKFDAPGTRKLAERQLGRWSLQQESGRPGAVAPCIALSRLPGCGGVEVGRRVAEWLDYGFFGREIVEQVAREMGVDHWLVEGLDERVRTSIERFLADGLHSRRFSENDYLRHVGRIIATLGGRGNAVILGRGSAFILPPERALRVLLIAPREQRIARYAEIRGLPLPEAEAALAAEEERRREFGKAQFGVRYDDPSHYDLVLNTGTLRYDGAAEVVIAALRRRFPT